MLIVVFFLFFFSNLPVPSVRTYSICWHLVDKRLKFYIVLNVSLVFVVALVKRWQNVNALYHQENIKSKVLSQYAGKSSLWAPLPPSPPPSSPVIGSSIWKQKIPSDYKLPPTHTHTHTHTRMYKAPTSLVALNWLKGRFIIVIFYAWRLVKPSPPGYKPP